MNSHLRSLTATVLLVGVFLFLSSFPCFAQETRVVFNVGLNDSGMARLDSLGRPVIEINPLQLESLGKLLADFVMAHEYAHIELGHLFLSDSAKTNPKVRVPLELRADCLAIQSLLKEGKRNVVIATSDHFYKKYGAKALDDLHPTGFVRSANIVACALSYEILF